MENLINEEIETAPVQPTVLDSLSAPELEVPITLENSDLSEAIIKVGELIDSDDDLTKFYLDRFFDVLIATPEVQTKQTITIRFGHSVETLSPHFQAGVKFIYEFLNDLVGNIPKQYDDEVRLVENAFTTLLIFVMEQTGEKREAAKIFIHPDFNHPNFKNNLEKVY